jgi:dolichol-phosphate mannosyltransferase
VTDVGRGRTVTVASGFQGDVLSSQPWPAGRVLVVTATFDESGSILALVDRVLAIDPALQMLVVDDDSPDGTGGIVLAAAASQPRLHCLVRRGRRGLGSAILEGLQLARGHGFEVAVNMDADFSHDPADIPRLLAALEPIGAPPIDVALGSRRVPGGRIVGWPVARRVTSVLVNSFTRWVIGVPARDSTSGFRAVRLAILDRIGDRLEEGYAFLEDMLWRIDRAGGRIIEVPITFTNRVEGTSKVGVRQALDGAAALLRMAIRTWWPGSGSGA